jgi:hypothetical protein
MPEAPDVVPGSREKTHDRPTPPGDERWTKHTRTLSCRFIDTASSKGCRRIHGTRRRHRTDHQIRRAELAPNTRHREPSVGSSLTAHATRLVRRALNPRCAAGDASGRHLQSTFQRRAPRFRSATTMTRRGWGDSRHTTHFVQLGPPPWPPFRRAWRWYRCNSDASVTTGRPAVTAARQMA